MSIKWPPVKNFQKWSLFHISFHKYPSAERMVRPIWVKSLWNSTWCKRGICKYSDSKRRNLCKWPFCTKCYFQIKWGFKLNLICYKIDRAIISAEEYLYFFLMNKIVILSFSLILLSTWTKFSKTSLCYSLSRVSMGKWTCTWLWQSWCLVRNLSRPTCPPPHPTWAFKKLLLRSGDLK